LVASGILFSVILKQSILWGVIMDLFVLTERINYVHNLAKEKWSEEAKLTLLKFVFLFNIFESTLFTKEERGFTAIKRICSDLKKEDSWFKIRDYKEYGDFFVKRYLIDRTHRIEDLNFEKDEYREAVEKALEKLRNGSGDNGDLFLCYLVIAYRFRNNLYHGSKAVTKVEKFEECFEQINKLFLRLLTDMVDNRYKGINVDTNDEI
jgi:hypothetical protein